MKVNLVKVILIWFDVYSAKGCTQALAINGPNETMWILST